MPRGGSLAKGVWLYEGGCPLVLDATDWDRADDDKEWKRDANDTTTINGFTSFRTSFLIHFSRGPLSARCNLFLDVITSPFPPFPLFHSDYLLFHLRNKDSSLQKLLPRRKGCVHRVARTWLTPA